MIRPLTSYNQFPRPADRETLPSFLCRVAASKSVDATEFAYDLDVSFRRSTVLDQQALERLAHWGGLSSAEVKELLSWTGEPIGDVRMRFRGEVFVTRALRNPIVRGCPACLREDALGCPQVPLIAMAMRGDWQMREMTVCVRHRTILVPLWKVKYPLQRARSDVHLAKLLSDIMAGDLDGDKVTPSAYDVWLSERLATGQDSTWLSSQALYAATTFCRLLGTELMRLADEQDPSRGAALCAGFAVAREGPEAIRRALQTLAAAADGSQDEPSKAFGGLWKELGWYLGEAVFATFIDLLRENVFETWPVPLTQPVLGKALAQRRLHSVRTATLETKIRPHRLRPLLVEAGAIAEEDSRPDSRATFDALKHDNTLKLLRSLMGVREMCAAMGATETELSSLEADGVLIARTQLVAARMRWLVADGRALIADLASRCIVTATDEKWETIQMAKVNGRVRVGAIISVIRAGQIRVYRPPGDESITRSCLPPRLRPGALTGCRRANGDSRRLTIAGEFGCNRTIASPSCGHLDLYSVSQ